MKVIVLAGGGGTRLFPLSRTEYPKQFLKLFSDSSLLVQSILRFTDIVKPEDIIVVTSKQHEFHVRNDLNICGMERIHILLEPERCNTAPAVALGVNYCKNELKCADDEIIFISSSDHVISPVSAFLRNVRQGLSLTCEGKIVVFGVKPYKPETGYGYMKTGEQLGCGYKVLHFEEKPNLETAQKYCDSEEYYWNSGMYIFQMNIFFEELEKYSSDIAKIANLSYKDMLEQFIKSPKISIDYALAEKTNKLAMVVLNGFWNDVGSWDSMYDSMDKDENGNAKYGDIMTVDCKKSLFIGTKRLVMGLGLDDLLIVETDDVVLVAKRGDSQRVRELVDWLQNEDRPEADNANTVYRPWGKYCVLDEGKSYKIKNIVVNPGASLSLQKHLHRSEHWVVTEGTARVLIDDKEQLVQKNQSVFVPVGCIHKLSNPNNIPLEIVEVQNGEYLGEDDIVRLADDYGRDLSEKS